MRCFNNIAALFFSLLLMTRAVPVQSQVAVNFIPAVYGQSLDGLAYAQIVNSSAGTLTAKVTIRVRQGRGTNVVTIVTAPFQLHPGVNPIDKRAFSASRFAFGNNNYGLTASQNGKFLEGEYEYCYEVDITDSKDPRLPPVYENCFVQQLQPRTPLFLVNPVDGDELCNKRPQFIWQPPVPLPADARFRLVLTAVKEKQDIVEAITYNPPVVNQANIAGNTLFYPSNAPELKEGQQYAWQVTVYAAQAILARSEVWTFTLKCQAPKKDTNTVSYRELREAEGGDFYVAETWLRFSLNNPYSNSELTYSITAMDDPAKPIKGLPGFKMAAGLNKYEIDLSENQAFKDGKEYLLTVRLANNRLMRLRFIYKSE
jgi:hypothetical protein